MSTSDFTGTIKDFQWWKWSDDSNWYRPKHNIFKRFLRWWMCKRNPDREETFYRCLYLWNYHPTITADMISADSRDITIPDLEPGEYWPKWIRR